MTILYAIEIYYRIFGIENEAFIVYLQRHLKEFRCITEYGGKSSAVYFNGAILFQVYQD